MEASKRERLELELKSLCEARDHARAVSLALESYGPEIRKLMMVVLKNDDWVNDAFGTFSESLLKSLPGFRWASSFRTWAYRVAHHTCSQYLRSLRGRDKLASDGALAGHPQPERTITQPWLRTEMKHCFRVLQEKLSPHEKRILALRVDRDLAWNDVAREMAGRDLSTGELRQRMAVLRQQYQRLKAHLRKLAIDEGLIDPDPC